MFCSGGPAEKCGQLKVKDEILKVNDMDFTQMRHSEAWNNLRFMAEGDVILLIRRHWLDYKRGGHPSKLRRHWSDYRWQHRFLHCGYGSIEFHPNHLRVSSNQLLLHYGNAFIWFGHACIMLFYFSKFYCSFTIHAILNVKLPIYKFNDILYLVIDHHMLTSNQSAISYSTF